MANVPNSTGAPASALAPKSRDTQAAKGCRELENEVCELTNMAGILSSFYDRCDVRPLGDECHVMTLSSSEWEQLSFAVYEVERRCRDLKKRYYAALDGSWGAQ